MVVKKLFKGSNELFQIVPSQVDSTFLKYIFPYTIFVNKQFTCNCIVKYSMSIHFEGMSTDETGIIRTSF